MLSLDLLKKCHTYDDIYNLVSMNNALHGEDTDSQMVIHKDKAFKIGGTELENCAYAISSYRNGVIGKNFLVYGHEPEGGRGLAYVPHGSKNITTVTPDEYLNFKMIHQECWYAQRFDTTFDLYIYGKKVSDSIISTDLLVLGNSLLFLQVDWYNGRSVVCANEHDLSRGVYCPSSREDFNEWFETNVSHLGYNGSLDMCNVSDIFRVYYEVQSCIFSNGSFVPIIT